jgi:predicted DNA-binding helix-hairpin-helix protein
MTLFTFSQTKGLTFIEHKFYNRIMPDIARLSLVTELMSVETDEDAQNFSCLQQPCSPSVTRHNASSSGLPIHMAALPNGKRVPILKTLLTSACERNCYYCACRAGRDFRRETFKPEEMAQWVNDLTKAGFIQGAFISSGIAGGGIHTQDRLIDTAEVLRQKLNYQGYLHLKIMPGSERDQVLRAMQIADRVSINLEAPNTDRLSRLAPQKIFIEELITPLRWVNEIRNSLPSHLGWKNHWPSSTTQFVAGGAGESDLELLKTTIYLHKTLRLARVYFSGFNPIQDTPLENVPAINPWRQNRLYQAAFLIRDYNFNIEDMPFQKDGDLPIEIDPKLAWAQMNLKESPVEINRADFHQLIRIPGIGLKGAHAILSARAKQKMKYIEELMALGISIKRAAPFILINGHPPAYQLSLF